MLISASMRENMDYLIYILYSKKVKFEIMLISAGMREKMDAKEVCK
jgi:hypothetical protein